MSKECSIDNNKKKCTCTYNPCSRKGLCCECVTYHRQQDELPACFFPAEVESSYDRSIARFIECYR